MKKGFARGILVGIGALALAIPAAAGAAGTGLNAYETRATAPALQALAANGFDIAEGRDGRMLEVVATSEQAAGLRKEGVKLRLKRDEAGRTAQQALRAAVAADGSYENYRPYWNDECTEITCYVGRDEEGNPRQTLYQEMVQLAEEHPDIVQPVEIGQTVNGAPILALRISEQDPRERHRGVSHHTDAVLSLWGGSYDVAWPAGCPVESAIAEGATDVEVAGWREACALLPLSYMGRGPDDDPWFFAAAFAAGKLARSLVD